MLATLREMFPMPFDPHAHLDALSSRDSFQRWKAWVQELFDLLCAAPEGKALRGKVTEAGLFLQLAQDYRGAFLDTLRGDDVESVLLDTYPQKVIISATKAGTLVRELRALFAFCGREFGLENMEDCRRAMTPALSREFRESLGDSSKFGMAKSLFF